MPARAHTRGRSARPRPPAWRFVCLALLVAAAPQRAWASGPQAAAGDEGRAVAAGTPVSVPARLGPVTVRAARGDRVLASATDARGRRVPVSFSDEGGAAPALRVEVDAASGTGGGPVALEVVVPAESPVVADGGPHAITAAGIASLRARTESGAISAREVRGDVEAETASGPVEVAGSGGVRARTGNGNVAVRGARGRVEVTTGNGNLEISDVEGDVRVTSINAKTRIRCVRGRVDVSDTSGVVDLLGIDGDVDALSSTGKANYRGPLYRGRRYRLKTLSGAVRFVAEGRRPGFTAELTTYAGAIETAGVAPPGGAAKAHGNRRLEVRNGEGHARIELDAFDGRVALVAVDADPPDPCGAALQ